METGQTHAPHYFKPLIKRIGKGEINPSFVATYRMKLADAPQGCVTRQLLVDILIETETHASELAE